MKRIILAMFIALIAAALIVMFAQKGKAKVRAKEQAVVEFPQKVKLLNVVLKGEYVFVHDEEKMARGEACTYVYTSALGQPGNLVVSFHCEPVERKKADHFIVVTSRLTPDLLQLEEYQFAGSTEGHQVPKE